MQVHIVSWQENISLFLLWENDTMNAELKLYLQKKRHSVNQRQIQEMDKKILELTYRIKLLKDLENIKNGGESNSEV